MHDLHFKACKMDSCRERRYWQKSCTIACNEEENQKYEKDLTNNLFGKVFNLQRDYILEKLGALSLAKFMFAPGWE